MTTEWNPLVGSERGYARKFSCNIGHVFRESNIRVKFRVSTERSTFGRVDKKRHRRQSKPVFKPRRESNPTFKPKGFPHTPNQWNEA